MIEGIGEEFIYLIIILVTIALTLFFVIKKNGYNTIASTATTQLYNEEEINTSEPENLVNTDLHSQEARERSLTKEEEPNIDVRTGTVFFSLGSFQANSSLIKLQLFTII